MIRFLPVLIELFLLVFCLIDCLQTPEGGVRNLGKVWWILLILFFPIVGGIAWLVAGRPSAAQRGSRAPWPSTRTAGYPEYERPGRPVAPDDDPEFLRQMRSHNAEHEEMLRKWEDDLRRREGDLGRPPEEPGGPDAPPASPTG